MNRTLARRLVAVVLALMATVAFAPAVQANGDGSGSGKAKGKAKAKQRANVTVMTRNLYLGTDLLPIVLAPTLADFEAAATAGFQQVQATNFPARARLIAREIRRTKPDLIGLQEVALWRTGPKGPAPATNVVYDYVRILRRALERTGQRYMVVRKTTEADVEGPTSGDFDVRLTMRDVILAKKRKGMRILRRGGGNFDAAIALETQAGTFTSTRGFAWADVKLRGKRFRFVDTHLEAFGNEVRTAQAAELVAPGGPARVRGRVILVGDLNSDPEGDTGPGPEPDAWQVLVDAGLRDTWPWLYPNRPGHACCIQDPGLMGPATFTHRIDDVLAKGRLRPLNARIVGTHPRRSRTRSGLWASDHGGLAVRIKLK
ncbi:MAG: endonuclease/exonuclease/phosphatase family protein [Thermoleophilaceae bacterium]